MKLGNETKVTADLTVVEAPKCPCCGSKNYYQTMTYDTSGMVTGKGSSCIDCRDAWCQKCNNGS